MTPARGRSSSPLPASAGEFRANECEGGAVRKFSVRPPLTDVPVTAYILAAAFDVISAIGGRDHGWSTEFWHAGTFTFVGGAAVSLLTALTGFWDWWKSSEVGTQARRTINTHAWIMITVTVLTLGDIAWRLNDYHSRAYTP